jgi:large subunit ribosomal protein L15
VFATDFTEVNVASLAKFPAGAVVDALTLKAAGVISRIGKDGVCILGRGDVTVALTVRAARFSASAREKITGAGGTVEEIA